ncbi:arginine--tRNA ligase [secondary endosymbiont of Ctenarytaina eucalypti]|uniref:arginine--tRNA ligase n=1 Tax=secondary endosymbiont of Ctenarytaina eucalypti TaxID=1199245 RepID=UPI0005C55948|nr:arginine--tRNA ligase [secondary endosymbiont of Ctenarytaina eucalypti]
MNIHTFLSKKIQLALVTAGASANCKAQVRHAVKPEFGHYQVNGIMAIAKRLDLPARTLAKKVIELVHLKGIARKFVIAGPGFINIFLEPNWLAYRLAKALSSPRLGIESVKRQTIAVDYSAPNIAKEMHVGHLRSTIIGDATVRTLMFLGHNVIKINHVGDWGTQFGMLIAYLEQVQDHGEAAMPLPSLESFYRSAKQHYDADPDFAERARSYVVKLQRGDAYCRRIWRKLVDVTIAQNQKIYDRLKVQLKNEDVMGESLYNDMLPDIVADLKAKGLAVESEGASVVFLEEFKNKHGEPMGVIIQKKDGAYLYTTTDIACAKYRYETLKADRIIYYIDSRQHQHLMQAWTIVYKAGYVPASVPLEHHMLGMMLGKDGRPFKTRSGGAIKLTALLDEALERARRLISTKNPSMTDAELDRLAQVVSIGAVKYADLSKNRTTDYVFDWDSILSFEGNTAPYIQYAYTRVTSIFKRSGQDEQQLTGDIRLFSEKETQLAVRLLQFEEAVGAVGRDGTPHVLCAYLYDLAVLFSTFYEHCPILHVQNEETRESRLKLSLLTARTLKKGLDLLGIETVTQM